ncbi:hypothetical protein FOZ62_026203 [Perkinsus olseni]|uniref:Glycosyltransferase 61 catalytic domain-containing protein n=1 Tax=Perkinsus olseni TaxID=32597 RepID=A0A7J6SL92_PEROL|nr:hypothetical protein FOZ62_026203 [Perkinsus olseni]
MHLSSPWAATLVLFLAAAVESDDRYDGLCDEMLLLAGQASQAAAQSRFDEAFGVLQKVRDLYSEAAALEPDDPQAHMTMANLELNANYMDRSLALWEEARRAVEKSEGSTLSSVEAQRLREHIHERSRIAEIGKVSMERDRVYKDGQGNITRSIELARRQVELVPEHPTYLHDFGTMYMMRSEVDPDGAWPMGVKYLWEAQTAAIRRASPVLRCAVEGRIGEVVEEGKLMLSEVELMGGDAVMFHRPSCTLTMVSAHLYLNLAQNLPFADPVHGTAPPAMEKWPRVYKGVFVTVGYRSTMFYHFLLESLARLVAMQEDIRATTHPQILLPWAPFVDELTDIVLRGLGIENARKVYYPTEGSRQARARLSEVVTYSWPPVADPSYGLPLHCITPSHLLQELRGAMVRGAGGVNGEASEVPLVLWIVRKASRDESRILKNERQLVAALRKIGRIDVREFDGAEACAKDAVALFSRAAVVVGVHGAGLSNILFCKEGAAVVELGFANPLVWHYMYVAEALGLRYERVLLDGAGQDERAMGKKKVSVNVEAAVSAVRRALGDMGSLVHDEM